MKIIPTYNKEQIPWEQIADSLQGELTAEGRAILGSSPAVQERYVLWQWLWREMLADYELYLQANIEAAIGFLRQRIQMPDGRQEDACAVPAAPARGVPAPPARDCL